MSESTENKTPKLAPPGAGVPLIQQLFMRFWLRPFVSKRAKRSDVRASYEAVCAKLISLVESVPQEKRSTRILVPPQPGLEDSSRYWSLNGVLEHVMIVQRAIEGGVLSLAAGKVPGTSADVASVKPKEISGDQLASFKEYAPGYFARIDEKLSQPGMNADSKLTFKHPWFGGLNAHQWYWLAASHLGIHYRQAKQIAKELR